MNLPQNEPAVQNRGTNETVAELGAATVASRILCALQPLELLEWALHARLEDEEYEVFTAPTLEARRRLRALAEELEARARCARLERASVVAPTGQPHVSSAEVSDRRPETPSAYVLDALDAVRERVNSLRLDANDLSRMVTMIFESEFVGMASAERLPMYNEARAKLLDMLVRTNEIDVFAEAIASAGARA